MPLHSKTTTTTTTTTITTKTNKIQSTSLIFVARGKSSSTGMDYLDLKICSLLLAWLFPACVLPLLLVYIRNKELHITERKKEEKNRNNRKKASRPKKTPRNSPAYNSPPPAKVCCSTRRRWGTASQQLDTSGFTLLAAG